MAENLVALHWNVQWFWRKYTEVDFYHNQIPIEVKHTETRPDIKNALLAAKNLGSKKLIVVTKDIDRKEKHKNIEIFYIPLWRFLLE